MKKLLYTLLFVPLALFGQNFVAAEHDIPLELYQGWNMFGYNCFEPLDLVDAFSTIIDIVVIVKDNSGSAYLPEWQYNGIGELEYARGYSIKLTDDVINFQFCPTIIPLLDSYVFTQEHIDAVNLELSLANNTIIDLETQIEQIMSYYDSLSTSYESIISSNLYLMDSTIIDLNLELNDANDSISSLETMLATTIESYESSILDLETQIDIAMSNQEDGVSQNDVNQSYEQGTYEGYDWGYSDGYNTAFNECFNDINDINDEIITNDEYSPKLFGGHSFLCDSSSPDSIINILVNDIYTQNVNWNSEKGQIFIGDSISNNPDNHPYLIVPSYYGEYLSLFLYSNQWVNQIGAIDLIKESFSYNLTPPYSSSSPPSIPTNNYLFDIYKFNNPGVIGINNMFYFGDMAFSPMGCMDQTSCFNSYNENASIAGYCYFASYYHGDGYDCNGVCLNDSDDDGVCDEFEILGCTNQLAFNYDEIATDDDGSCYRMGCLAEWADNYDHLATVDDGSCYRIGCMYALADNYDLLATIDDGSCTDYPIMGCMSDWAANYNPLATFDDGSCTSDLMGCLAEWADNYDHLATVDDGSCFRMGCMSDWADNYDPLATVDDGSCTL